MKLSDLTGQELRTVAEQLWNDVISDGTVDEADKQELLEEGPEGFLDTLISLGMLNDGEGEEEDWLEESDVSTEDVNNDGDTDLYTADTDDDGEDDVALVAADNAKEEEKASDKADEKLGADDKTSTGKTKKELDEDGDVVSDKDVKDKFTREGRVEDMKKGWGKTRTQRNADDSKKEDKKGTVSDERQKNILSALMDRIY